MKKIIHATTVHKRSDTRIRLKEVRSLADSLDADLSLFVMDGLQDETQDGYTIRSVGPRMQRQFDRLKVGNWRMYRALRDANPDIVHFHDPELIPIAILLKLSGVKIVYDVHEDVPRQVVNRPGTGPVFKTVMPKIIEFMERMGARLFDGICAATPTILNRFPPGKSFLIRNFPLLDEFSEAKAAKYRSRPPHFSYIGGLSSVRGTIQMIDTMTHLRSQGSRLKLAGNFTPEAHHQECEAMTGWSMVDFHGWSDRTQIAEILGGTRAGLVVLQPTQNYPDALPVKMFEYMSAGLPTIASDFPLWREIIEGAQCGLLVDPEEPKSIAKAMDWILENPREAEAMGRRGKQAVEAIYNWPAEASKLIMFYHEQLGVPLKCERESNTS